MMIPIVSPPSDRIDPDYDEYAALGVAADITELFYPHTEASREAILFQLLCCFGNIVGRGLYYEIEGKRHYGVLDVGVVGDTASGRKGTALNRVLQIAERVDPEWTRSRVQSGLSSGEGLITAVRDAVKKKQAVKGGDGRIVEYQEVIEDHGETDKRLLVIETEFSSLLQVLKREGNRLSALIRASWDCDDLRTMTKTPVCATAPHVSIITHITRPEFHAHLNSNDVYNGLWNRFTWVYAERSKSLPFPGEVKAEALAEVAAKLRCGVEFAKDLGQMRLSQLARTLWAAHYEELVADTERAPGLLSAAIARNTAMTLRLAMLIAAMNLSPEIEPAHLEAAVWLWRYCEQSARYVFGDSTGDRDADSIMRMLRERGEYEGVSLTDIHGRFSNNRTAEQIGHALSILVKYRLAGEYSNGEWFASG